MNYRSAPRTALAECRDPGAYGTSLVSLLRERAARQPEHTAYVFLDDGEAQVHRLTYAELDRRARAIAAMLQGRGLMGQRALLLYPPGLDYVEAFFGCLYAGVVAIPAYPPSRHHLSRLRAIVADATPALVLSTQGLQARLEVAAPEGWASHPLPWIATDTLGAHEASAWSEPDLTPESTAFLQYTSGSTGDPRGVIVSHGNLLANQESIRRAFQHTAASTVVGWLPLYHDMGLIGNLLQPLYVGATAVLMSPLSFLEKPVRWLRAITAYRACTSGGPNFAYELCVRKIPEAEKQDLDLSCWTLAFNGAETVRAATLDRFSAAFARCGFRRESFFPCYGLAEATLFVTGPGPGAQRGATAAYGGAAGAAVSAPDTPERLSAVSCGRSWGGQALRIVDPETRLPLEDGAVGEIWLSGASVAQGYWNRPAESERTFRAVLAGSPSAPADRWHARPYLRTGDLGFLNRGELYVTGRLKDLIIVRGRNYYPQDLEAAVDELADLVRPGAQAAFAVPGAEQPAVVLVSEVQRDAYRKYGDGRFFAAMRRALAAVSDLSDVVLVLVPPGAVPKTSSGKVRRRACREAFVTGALAELARSEADLSGAVRLPALRRDPGRGGQSTLRALSLAERVPLIEAHLIGAVARALGVPSRELSCALPLRAFGLDSLRIVELKHALDEWLEADVPLAELLADRPITALASRLGGLPAGQPDRCEDRSDVAEGFVLSYSQRSMWTMQRLEPGSIGDNLHLALRLEGDVDPERFQRALASVGGAHPMLHTVYLDQSAEPLQQTLFRAESIACDWIDAAHWSQAQLQQDMTARTRQPFALSNLPLVRAALYRCGPRDHALLLCAHHIAIDFWSLLILIQQIPVAYRSGSPPKPALRAAPYRAFVDWQRHYLASERGEQDWQYWREQLDGTLPLLALPTDFTAAGAEPYRGASVRLDLTPEFTARLRELARSQGATLFALLLAAYKVLLSRYAQQPELMVGIPGSGRAQSRFAETVGNFVNPLPIRSFPEPAMPFRTFLTQVRDAVLRAQEHQDFPFSLLVERLAPKRHSDRWPLYQTWFVLQQAQAPFDAAVTPLALGETGARFPWGDWSAQPLAIEDRVENFDLKLMAAEGREGLCLSFQYRTEVLAAATVARLAANFECLLRSLVADPRQPLGELPVLADRERALVLAQWNRTATDYGPAVCLSALFERQVARSPDAPALACGDTVLSYRELADRVRVLADRLRQQGVGPETVVAICARRSPELVIGLFAILEAGGAYLPLDPDDPLQRLAGMVDDAGARLVLIQPALVEHLPGLPGERLLLDTELPEGALPGPAVLARPARADNLAYVLYTSGSTGRPKGVGISHRGLVNRLFWMQQRFALSADDAVLQKTPYTFDVSVWEFFWPLVNGARLVLAATDAHRDAEQLAATIERHRVTTVHFVPSMLRAFLETPGLGRCGSLQRVICSGEALTPELRDRFFERLGAELHNLYGPTEASIDVTHWACERSAAEREVPIGRPIANTRLYVLDGRLNPAPIGVSGELYIGGVQLARGYCNRPDLTAERFVPDPFGAPGTRLYRTGDRAHWRPDGTIAYDGRADHQVKIRGFRIELGEIEAALLQCPGVREAAVLARTDRPDDGPRLVAYVAGSGSLGSEPLQAHLHTVLPDYMVPGAWVFLDALPLTSSGKLDRKALPAPERHGAAAGYAPPQTHGEQQLAAIWAEVLGVEQVGIHDNFFALGGDSILSIQVASRAHQVGVRIVPKQLFEHQTIAALARAATAVAPNVADQGRVTGAVPLTPIQRWFFALPLADAHHWNQAVLLEPVAGLQQAVLLHAIAVLLDHHDALRLRFTADGTRGWHQDHADVAAAEVLVREDLAAVSDVDLAGVLGQRAAYWQQRFDLARGPLLRVVWFDRGGAGADRLLLIAHHLVVDLVSWSILLEDLDRLCGAGSPEQAATLPAKTSAYRDWAQRLLEYAHSLEPVAGATVIGTRTPWPVDHAEGRNDESDAAVLTAVLPVAPTRVLLTEAPTRFRVSVQEVLLAALAAVVADWSGRPAFAVDVESHGRDAPFGGVDVTRTVGWFTSLQTLQLDVTAAADADAWLRHVKQQVRSEARTAFERFSRAGLPGDASPLLPAAPVLLNYHGSRDLAAVPLRRFKLVDGAVGPLRGPRNRRRYEWEINAWVEGEQLRLEWAYSAARYDSATIGGLARRTLKRVESLAAECVREGACGLSPVDFPLATLTADELERLPVPAREIEDIYPLSPMQEGLLFHTLMAPQSGIYLMQDRYQLRGNVDVEAVRGAWQAVIDRHPVLRTAFAWKAVGQPHQVVLRRVELVFEYRDWRAVPEAEQHSRRDALLPRELETGFDLSRAPLMRVRLFRMADSRYEMVRSHHHILTDAWCTSLILTDFKRCYRALVEHRPTPAGVPRPYRDYIAWLQRQDPAPSRAFWRRSLAGLTEPTPLVVERHASVDEAEGAVADAVLLLSERHTAALNTRAQQCQLTPNTLVQAAWALLLSRYSGRDDIVFGVTVAGRPTELPGIDATLGLFINSLPLRVRVPSGQPVIEFLRGLLASNLELRQHEHTPLVDVQACSEIPRGQALFQHLYVFENTPLAADLRAEVAGVRMSELAVRTQTNYPLTAVIIPGERLHLQITYQCRRFAPEVVGRMLGHFHNLLIGLIETPGARLKDIPLMSPEEYVRIVREWNRTDGLLEAQGDFVIDFEAQVERCPDAIAVECAGATATYGELNRRANRLAWGLMARGVGPETRVALLDDRGIDLMAMIIAVFKAGAAYVPLDPAHPDGRIAAVLSDSRAPLVVTGERHLARAEGCCGGLLDPPGVITADQLAALGRPENPHRPRGPQALAYVIFTSGSTGRPKGVMIEQRGLFNNLMTKVPALGLTERDVIAQTASQCFDISVWQFLTGLLVGARVVIVPDAIARDPERLITALDAQRVTILEAVPSMIAAMLEVSGAATTLASLRWLLPSGEAFPPDACRRWMRRYPHVALLNAYGPAECSDDVSYHPVAYPGEDERTIPIGRPVPNTRLYVLDRELDPVPAGIPGEICVGGLQVGRGYAHAPGLTAVAFVPDPFGEPGGRLYRTGDLGRFRADGVLEFLGRLDHQLKIRGHRIEPGEIEACLTAHPQISEAVVLAHPSAGSSLQLVAYLVGERLTPQAVREHLGRTLPNYMIPAAFVFLDALPLNANGKVDRRRLPEPDVSAQPTAAGGEPRTPTEELLSAIWSEVLGVPHVGIRDDFFDLGGHSLLATQVMSRVSRAFRVDLPLRTLFAEPTLVALAAAVDAARSAQARQLLPPIQPVPRGEDLPLSRAQLRLWYAQQLDPENPFYNFRVGLRISGELDLSLLQRAITLILCRHESLRTTFIERDGVPRQRIAAEPLLSFTVEDLNAVAVDSRDEALRDRMTLAARVPFDLQQGPLVRVHAYDLGLSSGHGERQFGLLFVVHHLVFDGWSMIAFFQELSAVYGVLPDDHPALLPELPLQYADYAAWQQGILDHPALAPQVAYWREQLAGAPALSTFPSDRARSASVQTLADSHLLDLGGALDGLSRYSRQHTVSLFMTCFAAYQVLLHYLTGAEDLVIGADIAGRNRPETEPLIGFFINLLALRTRLDANASFDDVVSQVRDATLAAYANQDLPFDRVLELARPERIPGATPLFQVKLVFHNIPFGTLGLPGLEVEPLAIETGRTELDLVLHLHQQGDDFHAVFEYRRDLFDAASIARFASLYRTLLRSAPQRPALTLTQLRDLLAAAEREAGETARAVRRRADLGRLAERRAHRTSHSIRGGAES